LRSSLSYFVESYNASLQLVSSLNVGLSPPRVLEINKIVIFHKQIVDKIIALNIFIFYKKSIYTCISVVVWLSKKYKYIEKGID